MSLRSTEQVLALLDRGQVREVPPIWLGLGDLRLKLLCAEPLHSVLHRYYAPALAGAGQADAVVEVLDGQTPDAEFEWLNWAREPGKTGRKDAIHDLEDGRLVHKIRTGVTFLQSEDAAIAFGPCADHPNQVVNFVNSQFLNISLRRGWQICHAAAVTGSGRTLAVAGLSGGGKSTTVLRLMELSQLSFVTNDRLLVRGGRPYPDCLGIPKEPRINPGTILHNPRLHGLLNEERRAELSRMPQQELWQLEEKHDLVVADVFGADRVRYEAELTDFWVLNWRREDKRPTTLVEVDLADRPDLLGAIMKSAGPFYQKPDGRFLRDDEPCIAVDYLKALSGVHVREVTGRIDFDALYTEGRALFGQNGP